MASTKENKLVVKRRILNTIVAIFSVLIILITLITTVSTIKASNLAFLEYRFYVMEAESQPEIAKVGDLVITKKVRNNEIKEKDTFVYKDGKYYYCDEIVETRKNGSIVRFLIAERNGVVYRFAEEDIEGKIVRTIPTLGSIVNFFKTPLGIVIYILFTLCVFGLLWVICIRRKNQE